MDEIYSWFSEMDDALLHASGIYPGYKIEERITIVLYHARLYLSGSDDDWDDKSVNENTLNISCGGGGSRSSL